MSLSLPLFWGCKKNQNHRQVVPIASPGPTQESSIEGVIANKKQENLKIAVIDSGFDLGHEVFSDKLIGSHTIDCSVADPTVPAVTPTQSANTAPLSFEQKKAQLIAGLKSQDRRCKLRPGLELYKSHGLKTYSKYRSLWNSAVLQKNVKEVSSKIPNFKKFLEVLGGDDGDYIYHGTSTAGLIAYQNPRVELVLVQMQIAKPGDSAGGGFECPTQKEIDDATSLFSDKDVLSAFASEPLPQEEEQMLALFSKQGVKVVNMSFGTAPREVLEKMLKDQCGQLDFRAYFKADHDIESAKARAGKRFDSNQKDVVFIQSAGNDGVAIESGQDTPACKFEGLSGRALVGSFDANQKVSEFSNRGECVDVFTLGEDVVVAAPDNFVTVASGTSFSAPLFVRFLSKDMKAHESAQVALERVIKMRGQNRFLPESTFPSEIAFLKTQPVTQYALSSGTGTRDPLLPYSTLRNLRRARAILSR